VAIFSWHCRLVKRSKGHSVVEAAARCSSLRLHDARLGQIFDYRRKKPVVFRKLVLPEQVTKTWQKREFLWNAVEVREKRKDAQLARILRMALPIELNRKQQVDVLMAYARRYFLPEGMAVDMALLDLPDNPTAYCLLTLRVLDVDGWGEKKTAWNRRSQLIAWRAGWATEVNTALESAGFATRIDHRSLAAQGKAKVPQIHLGAAAFHAAKRGVHLDRWVVNQAIQSAHTQESVSDPRKEGST
jgi:hypothetical protein